MLAHVLALAARGAALHAQSPVAAHPRLDETTGLTAGDSGPRGVHGSLVNLAAAPWVAGRYGNALAFDGVDDYVSFTTPSGLPSHDARRKSRGGHDLSPAGCGSAALRPIPR